MNFRRRIPKPYKTIFSCNSPHLLFTLFVRFRSKLNLALPECLDTKFRFVMNDIPFQDLIFSGLIFRGVRVNFDL